MFFLGPEWIRVMCFAVFAENLNINIVQNLPRLLLLESRFLSSVHFLLRCRGTDNRKGNMLQLKQTVDILSQMLCKVIYLPYAFSLYIFNGAISPQGCFFAMTVNHWECKKMVVHRGLFIHELRSAYFISITVVHTPCPIRQHNGICCEGSRPASLDSRAEIFTWIQPPLLRLLLSLSLLTPCVSHCIFSHLPIFRC